MLEDLLSRLIETDNGLSPSERALLLVVLTIGGKDGRCYMNVETLGAHAGLKKRQTIRCLKTLTDRGWLLKSDASGEDVPKSRGSVYRLGGVFMAPSDASEGAIKTPSDAPEVQELHCQKSLSKTSKTLENKAAKKPKVQESHPSRSTTTDLLSDDAGSGGATSRARAATDSATQPTPEEQVSRLQEEIVTALAGVDKYHPDPERQARHAVKQNRKHVRLILEKIGGLEEAIDYVQIRGVEWCARVKAGADYSSPVILSHIAKDAAEGWTRPTDPAGDLKRMIDRQIKKQLAGKASRVRAGWLDEWELELRAAEREQLAAEPQAEHVPAEEPAREPVKLGAVVADLVPAVTSAARRTPQPAEEAGERPAWWPRAVAALGADLGVSLGASGCAALLLHAMVKRKGSQLQLMPSPNLLQHEAAMLDKHAAEWLAAIARHASDAAGQRLTVCWGTRSAAPALPVAPREVPTWWPQLIARLRASAASHAASRASDAAATSRRLELVADTLQAARRAVWSADVLTVEVDALGQLAAASAVVCAAIGWAVALELDLASEAEVVLVDLSAGEEVWNDRV